MINRDGLNIDVSTSAGQGARGRSRSARTTSVLHAWCRRQNESAIERRQAWPDERRWFVPAVTVSPPAAGLRDDDAEQPGQIVEREHLLACHGPGRGGRRLAEIR